MTYVNCPSCGQKALDVASRCPRCGAPFEEQFSQRRESTPKRRRIPKGPLIVVAVGVGLWMVAARLHQPGAVPATRPTSPSDSALQARPGPIRESLIATADSSQRDSSPPARAPGESLPPRSGLAPAADPSPVDAGVTLRRYTTTWINVRAGRSNKAAVIGVLRPRQMVMVGSLARGWYRVFNQPQAPGYVDGRYLSEALPPGPR